MFDGDDIPCIFIYFFVSTTQQVRGVSAVNGSGFRERQRRTRRAIRQGDVYNNNNNNNNRYLWYRVHYEIFLRTTLYGQP